MKVNSVVIFVPDDTRKTGRSLPLMLERVHGVSLLSWLAASLAQDGAHRFFLVAQPGTLTQAKACFPSDVELMVCADQEPGDLLHVFLSSTEESEPSVAVITGPAVYIRHEAARPAGKTSRRTAVCLADREALMEALDHEFSFSRFLVEQGTACKEDQGFYSVSDYEELLFCQQAMNRDQVLRLCESGANVWDMDRCTVSPWAAAGAGTQLLPGTILAGTCNIGAGCTLGPDAYIADSSIADGVRVASSWVLDSHIGQDAQVGPFAYVHQGSFLGASAQAGSFAEVQSANLGAGSRASGLSYVYDAALKDDEVLSRGTMFSARSDDGKGKKKK